MALPELKRSFDAVEPLSAGGTASDQETSPIYDEAVRDAERLMKYAAEIGIDVDDDTRNHVLQARASGTTRSDEETANLLKALTKLAARLRPVTAESLKECTGIERRTVHGYRNWAISLAVIIVPFSVASFVTTATSDAIRKDIVTANDLAVKLTTQLGPLQATAPVSTFSGSAAQPNASGLPPGLAPVDVVTELQQFAAIIREIDRRALQLNPFVLHLVRDPYENKRGKPEEIHKLFELPLPLDYLPQTANERISVYQDVRYFAQGVLDDVSFFYGAFTTYLLPVLYALLGTCAYLIRSFEEQIRTKTFTPAVDNSARFLIAGIGGAVVGLFSNFTITQGPSIPPLAIAFLVGYAVDVFYSFLEGLLQTFTRAKNGMTAPARPDSR
jgi:hypothetical protein